MNETEKQIREKMEQSAKQAEKLLPDLNSENTAKREAARAQHAAFIVEFDKLETQLENIMSQENSLTFNDPVDSRDHGERAEVRRLLNRTSIGDYVRAASQETMIEGAAVELCSAFGIPVGTKIRMPIHMLLDERAATTTTQLDGPEMQRPVLPRLFEGSLAEFLGVRMDTVPYGQSQWPLIATGATAATVAEAGKAADPTAATFTTITLKPYRYQARLAYTMEMLAHIGAGLESYLRMDMRNALMDVMNGALLSGTGTAPQGTGLKTRIAAATAPTAVIDYEKLAAIPAAGVDAIHATDPSQVRVLIGLATLAKAEAEYKDGVGQSGFEVLQRRSGGVRVSAKVDAPPDAGANRAHVQDVFLFSAGMGMRTGDSACAVWPSIQLIRDDVTDAAEGTVQLHAIMLSDFYMALRSGAYKRLAVKLA